MQVSGYRARFLCALCRGDDDRERIRVGDRRRCDECGTLKYCSECFFEVKRPAKQTKRKKKV